MLLTIGDGTDFRSVEEMQVSRNLASRFRSTLKSNDSYKWMLDDLKIQESFAPYFSMKNATLKLFLLDTVDENGNPLCVRSFKIFDKIDEQTITSLLVDETNQLIVFGCESGDVFLIQGDLSRAKKCVPILLPKHLHSSITNLHFSRPTPVVLSSRSSPDKLHSSLRHHGGSDRMLPASSRDETHHRLRAPGRRERLLAPLHLRRCQGTAGSLLSPLLSRSRRDRKDSSRTLRSPVAIVSFFPEKRAICSAITTVWWSVGSWRTPRGSWTC